MLHFDWQTRDVSGGSAVHGCLRGLTHAAF